MSNSNSTMLTGHHVTTDTVNRHKEQNEIPRGKNNSKENRGRGERTEVDPYSTLVQ